MPTNDVRAFDTCCRTGTIPLGVLGMTKIISPDTNIIHSLVKLNAGLIWAASDHMIVFNDNADVSKIKEAYPDIKIEEYHVSITKT